jgi:hypothetical protein
MKKVCILDHLPKLNSVSSMEIERRTSGGFQPFCGKFATAHHARLGTRLA